MLTFPTECNFAILCAILFRIFLNFGGEIDRAHDSVTKFLIHDCLFKESVSVRPIYTFTGAMRWPPTL